MIVTEQGFCFRFEVSFSLVASIVYLGLFSLIFLSRFGRESSYTIRCFSTLYLPLFCISFHPDRFPYVTNLPTLLGKILLTEDFFYAKQYRFSSTEYNTHNFAPFGSYGKMSFWSMNMYMSSVNFPVNSFLLMGRQDIGLKLSTFPFWHNTILPLANNREFLCTFQVMYLSVLLSCRDIQ